MAQQRGRVSLYDWIVYKRESKARERKGEKEQRRLMFYKIFASRDRNIRQSMATCRCVVLPSSASAVTLPIVKITK